MGLLHSSGGACTATFASTSKPHNIDRLKSAIPIEHLQEGYGQIQDSAGRDLNMAQLRRAQDQSLLLHQANTAPE
jgi:hypothetical protein